MCHIKPNRHQERTVYQLKHWISLIFLILSPINSIFQEAVYTILIVSEFSFFSV